MDRRAWRIDLAVDLAAAPGDLQVFPQVLEQDPDKRESVFHPREFRNRIALLAARSGRIQSSDEALFDSMTITQRQHSRHVVGLDFGIDQDRPFAAVE
jgi:hypothetical protein